MTVRFQFLGVIVADMAKSLAFYRRLGLEFPADSEKEPHAEAALPGGLTFALDTIDVIHSFDPGWTPPSGGHHVGLAFACDTVAEVDARYTELVSAGYEGHLEPWDAFWGMRYATVYDPDGNSVELFATPPAAPTT